MSYGDVVVAVIYAIQMMICVLFALPYKRSRKHIFLLALVTVVEYFFVKLPTLYIEIYWLAYVVEFFGTILVLALFNSGNIWRNFLISWFNFQCANLLIIVECAVVSHYIDMESIVIFGATGENDKYIIAEILLMLCNALIALGISRKIFKFEYNNDGKIYKYLVAVIVILGTILGLKKNYMIAEHREDSSLGVYNIYVTAIVIIIVLMYVLGYIYNFAENRRLIKERENLKQIIEKNYAQYESAIENNKNLEYIKNDIKKYQETAVSADDVFKVDANTFSLSGNLTIDTLVAEYYKEAKENDITIEMCVFPLNCNVERDMKLATIVDELMQYAINSCKNENNTRWIYFRISQDMNSIIIKLEYSTAKRYKLNAKKFKLTHRLVILDKGAIRVENKDREVSISILLP